MSAMVSRIRHHLSACRCCRGAGRGGSPLSGWSVGKAASSNTKQPADGSCNPAFLGDVPDFGCTLF